MSGSHPAAAPGACARPKQRRRAHPFFEGIRDELGIACEVESQLIAVEPEARLSVRYVFRGVP
jgi:hypothetical protein